MAAYVRAAVDEALGQADRAALSRRALSAVGRLHGGAANLSEDHDQLIARKAQVTDPVDAAWGILDMDDSVDQFIERIRGR